jgi:hypothetical protein
MTDNSKPCVLLDIDFGCLMLMWTPDITVNDMEEWFLGLTKDDVEILWSNPRSLPGRITQMQFGCDSPSHVINVEGKDYASLCSFHRETGMLQTIFKKNFSSP